MLSIRWLSLVAAEFVAISVFSGCGRTVPENEFHREKEARIAADEERVKVREELVEVRQRESELEVALSKEREASEKADSRLKQLEMELEQGASERAKLSALLKDEREEHEATRARGIEGRTMLAKIIKDIKEKEEEKKGWLNEATPVPKEDWNKVILEPTAYVGVKLRADYPLSVDARSLTPSEVKLEDGMIELLGRPNNLINLRLAMTPEMRQAIFRLRDQNAANQTWTGKGTKEWRCRLYFDVKMAAGAKHTGWLRIYRLELLGGEPQAEFPVVAVSNDGALEVLGNSRE